MRLIIVDDYEQMSKTAAALVADVIRSNPHASLGLTTGNTPIGMYEELSRMYRANMLSFRHTNIFCLEEYLGVGPEDERSLFSWLSRMFITPNEIPADHIHRLRGEDIEPQRACERFDDTIRRIGGLDLIVEGIGVNGHVGFNEPGSLMESRCRVVALSKTTLDYNTSYWNAEVPHYGMTVGIGNILEAKEVILMASGHAKALPLYHSLQGNVHADVPASYLQHARHLTVIADKEAAASLAFISEESS
ncbi:glucosamine-6-phosphate deaminase [Paenibacillus lignilyticus]|uniref:Glucosamine-6-phosphate deaminase n=1 Tax=Paenibacillus lignilyticus TaxID=1172615 RepID=A0ABS5C9R4_9BACL|nr:glucosamine-6-phosphate deaminase [Paenibacillus lignilyticus]MBP3962674.1 glucosamine-6-phosphate deaminase [Paenibacillus lignilyticus]